MKNKFMLLSALVALGATSFAKEVVVEPVVVEEAAEVQVVETAPVVETKSIYVDNNVFTKISVGQSLEIDNTSGDENIGEAVLFMNEVKLGTENWDFRMAAGTDFSSDSDDYYNDGTARIELEAIRNFDNYFAGFRWRAEDDYNRFYFKTGYEYGMFSGWMDAQYWSFDTTKSPDEQDKIEIEIMPANVKLGPVTVGYYLDYINYVGDGQGNGVNKLEESYDHQLRAYVPVFSNEKWAFDLEYRLGLSNDKEYNRTTAHKTYDDFNYNALILNARYAVNESLDIYGYYRYDIKDYEEHDGKVADLDSDKYYGEFLIGWEYSF